jgi:hypothetical protein
MTTTASIPALVSQWADQLQALLKGDLTPQEFQDQTGLDPQQTYECLNQYVNSVNQVADTYNLGGDQIVHLPAPPPVPPGSPAAVYETVVNNYQTNIVNDYSTEVNQIFNNNGDVDINQAVAGAGGIANTGTIDDSVLAAGGGDVTFGDNTAIGNDGSTVTQTGDVTASDGSAVNTGPGGSAETTGSGNDFGAGSQGNVNAVSDSTDVNQNANQADVDISGTGGDASGGAGGAGGDYGDGGAGGAGGYGGDGVDDSPVHIDQSNEQDVTHHDAPHTEPTHVDPIL